MNHLRRLLRYARPYRGRFLVAVVAMVLYGGASVWLLRLIQPIVDRALPRQEAVASIAWAILGAYLLKGLGSYVSAYLMADIGQLVVLDLRKEMFRHTLGQSAAFFKSRTTGQLLSRLTNDIAQVQQAASETITDLVRESLTVIGYAGAVVLPGRRPGARVPHRCAAHYVSARAAGIRAARDDQAKPGTPGAHVPHGHGGLHGAPHRQGVRGGEP